MGIKPPGEYNYPGSSYTPEEVEFLKALDKYKHDHNCPCPTWPEVLAIVKACGWRKVKPAVLIPGTIEGEEPE